MIKFQRKGYENVRHGQRLLLLILQFHSAHALYYYRYRLNSFNLQFRIIFK